MKIIKAWFYRPLGGLTTLALVVLLLTTLCGCTKIQSQTEGSLQASTQRTESSKGYDRISQVQVILGHIVEMTQLLREYLEGREGITVLNRVNFGTVTLFRAYPDGVDTFEIKEQEFRDANYRDTLLKHNAYNRKIFEYVHSEALKGRGVVISMTDCYRNTAYGEPIVALKSFILSPFIDETDVKSVVDKVLEAREKVK